MDDTTKGMTGADGRGDGAESSDAADVMRRTAQVRDEIEDTREEMADTIDAIQEKLRPRNIVANATESVKTATTERIRVMTDTAGEAAQTMMDRTRDTAGGLVSTIRDNPYPAALIGVGLAWLMMGSSRSRNYGYGYQENDWRSSDRGYGSSGSSYGGSRYDSGSRGYRDRVGESAEKLMDRGREYAEETSQRITSAGRRVQTRFETMLTQNPLLVGAGALLVGAAFGLAVPETDTENAWMGEARDSVVDQAQEYVGDAAQKLQDTARKVADSAGNVADSMNR